MGGPVPALPVPTGTFGLSVPGASSLSNLLTNNPVTGFLNNITSLVPTSFYTSAPQLYVTVPFPNNQPALYQLTLLTDRTNPNAIFTTYIFPISPSAVTKEFVNLSNYYDVRGPSATAGVTRIADQYGQTLPIINISGTTGFQYHSVDGFKWSGRTSMSLLLQILKTYAVLMQNAIDSASTIYPGLIYSDSFRGDIYEVVPFGPQAVGMDQSKPIIQEYNIRLMAITDLSAPIPTTPPDTLAQSLIESQGLLAIGFLTFWQDTLDNLSSIIGTPS